MPFNDIVVNRRKGTTADDVALAPEAVLAMQDFSLQKTISSIEGRIDRGEMESHVALDMADVIPHSANEMGSGNILIHHVLVSYSSRLLLKQCCIVLGKLERLINANQRSRN